MAEVVSGDLCVIVLTPGEADLLKGCLETLTPQQTDGLSELLEAMSVHR